jgi:signal transduction histidine kinase
MIGINLDITDQKRQQEEIIRSEKEKNEALENVIKLKDEFLYLITHEFKTPLTVIKAAIQAMDMICGKEMPEKADKFLNSIKQNTNRQLRLVNNLLDVTRINAGEIRLKEGVFDVEYLIRSIVDSIQPYAQHKKVKLNFTARFDGNEILIDEEKIERIILNLVSNALKFTPEGKSIDIGLCRKRYRNRNMICITVTDQGIGIPKSKQDKIFERFGQADTSLSRQAEGTGIGLYLVKLYVNAMNGGITLRSREGKGSTFTVMLPCIEATPLERITAGSVQDGQVMGRDSRLIQAVAVEFSDIYF